MKDRFEDLKLVEKKPNEKLIKRMNELKEENNKANEYLQQLEQEKNKVIQEALTRNGRILEIADMLKED